MPKGNKKIQKPRKKGGVKASPISFISPNQSEFVEDKICFNFKHYDASQSDCYKKIEEAGKLSKVWDNLIAYWQKTITEANSDRGKRFTIYWEFPPSTKTAFSCPRFVSEDANWTRIHVTWEMCIIWYVVRNVFYIVFLDKDHKFWISDKKHT